MEYFIKTFEDTVRRCWDKPALDEYRTSSETYGQVAADIEAIHIYFEAAGLKPGDKIAINARSSANWIKTFMAAVSGGYVAVELFNGYTARDAQALVDHSDSRLLFTGESLTSSLGNCWPRAEISRRVMHSATSCSSRNIRWAWCRLTCIIWTARWMISAQSCILQALRDSRRASC